MTMRIGSVASGMAMRIAAGGGRNALISHANRVRDVQQRCNCTYLMVLSVCGPVGAAEGPVGDTLPQAGSITATSTSNGRLSVALRTAVGTNCTGGTSTQALVCCRA